MNPLRISAAGTRQRIHFGATTRRWTSDVTHEATVAMMRPQTVGRMKLSSAATAR